VTAPAPIQARVLALVVPVCTAGLAALAAAAFSYARGSHSAADMAGLVALFAAVALAEQFPVPVEGLDSAGVTLGFVFVVATIVLYGWQAGVIVAAGAPTLAQIAVRRPPLRATYNGAMFALAALAGGLAADRIGGTSVGGLIARVALCALLYNWVVNLTLLSGVLALDAQGSFRRLAWTNARRTTAPFALMTSASLMLVVLWQRSPLLAAALIGPLLAIGLYQRSTFAALQAMRLALTDPLTGLGNQRHFQEQLLRAVQAADEAREPLSLCLVDVDDFKAINDRYGHPEGDLLLEHVASRLRQGGEAFRLGGDEFAVLLPGHGEQAALDVATSIVERVAASRVERIGRATVSAGVATFPTQSVVRDGLIRLADSALYWAKEDGKDCARVYEPPPVDVSDLADLAELSDQHARYRAAASLARAVDARDAYTGRHSERVSELAVRIARRLGIDEADIELTRLAASLHDLGKLAIPEEILRKPSALDDAERMVLQRHPRIGYRMLESLGVEPVAACVLHHHERWDGAGYPDRLRADQIPLGARIIFVADAFDAMTSERVYRESLSIGEAITEIERCAGSQFDPTIVHALADEIGAQRVPALVS
jgi:diguanylate cyclase (GGDEF)-like protein/putative nucleotidyltransferase with HDIG domain